MPDLKTEIVTCFNPSPDAYDEAWARERGLPTQCPLCGLPFDRTGRERHVPDHVISALIAGGESERALKLTNTHCPRYIGADEMWDCNGKSIR